MTQIPIPASRPYSVHIGSGVLAELPQPDGPTAILSDSTVAGLYRERLDTLRVSAEVVVAPGEESKSFATLERVLGEFAEGVLDRSSTLITLGGGVVGDLGGLAASLYMRGIEVIHCPTTLLAMVDASVGGKTAVNLASGKNLAGTFKQPLAVYADVETLSTLDLEQLRSGFGEVIKSALIGDAELLEWLDSRTEACLAGEPEVLAEVVARCVRVKARVVAADEREAGRRKVLNLGHTFAHAIEQVAGYGTISHGVAVGVGLVLALEAGLRTELLEDTELPGKVGSLLEKLGMPRSLDDLRESSGTPLPPPALQRAMTLDKKSAEGRPRFVLVRRAGQVEADSPLEDDLIESLLTPV